MSRIRSVHPDTWPVRSGSTGRHIYVIQEGEVGPVKVGIAGNAFWRIFDLQAGNYRPLHIRAVFYGESKRETFVIEQAVHAALAGCSIAGEWFDCSPETAVAAIEREAACD